ncbi:MAG TPA: SDR family oxidoreductase [Acidimicrobiales bacterium]|jgi:NAD(P)-dependent dehydrogenase (short-subunit alcohol dehydrogenase family)|nr:SDR family oxidoreductase [Acidimicrobiales bacterium]
MSMHGKVVVVTGSNVGIGLETAVGVAERGATTVLACRNQAKADAAAAVVTQRTWNDDVHVVVLDLADLASVRKAAEEILSRWGRLDVLVNNAGGTWTQRQHTAQGIEYTFGVNHLGHFYLTNLLLDRLRADAPARVVSVTSVGHHAAFGGMQFDDLQSEKRYEGMEVYCRSKLANVLFTRELAKRLQGSGVTANAAHPGWVRSSFAMDGDTTGFMGFGMRVIRPVQISPWRGAKTSIYLATSPDVAGKTAMYWVRSKPGHMSRHARDDAAAERLWDESERILASSGFPLG